MNREHKSNKRSKIFTTDCITIWYSGRDQPSCKRNLECFSRLATVLVRCQ